MILAGCSHLTTSRQQTRRQVSTAYYQKGQTLMEHGDLAAALEALNKSVKADPQFADAHTALGDIHRKRGEYPQAAQSYRKACELAPYSFRPHYNLGVTYQKLAALARQADQMQQYIRQAVAVYIRAVTIDANSFDAQLNLGACYYQLGQFALAEEHTTQALLLNPKSPRANGNLGIVSEAMGKYEQAIMAYKAALEIDTNQPTVLMNLGRLYMKQGHYRLAMNTFQTATRVDPDNPAPWKQVGLCRFRLQQLDEAVQAFQQAIRLDPENPGAYRGFGVICMYQYLRDRSRNDLKEKAIQAWQFSLQLQPDQADLKKLVDRYGQGVKVSRLRLPTRPTAIRRQAPAPRPTVGRPEPQRPVARRPVPARPAAKQPVAPKAPAETARTNPIPTRRPINLEHLDRTSPTSGVPQTFKGTPTLSESLGTIEAASAGSRYR
jgi:tetratricopeptide (TPR) repeat protein